MVYNDKLQKGVQVRSFTPVKVAFYKESTHAEVLKKCTKSVWKDDTSDFDDFYLSDGSGSLISADDICIDIRENKTIFPWTLSNYLKVSGIKFLISRSIRNMLVRILSAFAFADRSTTNL